MRHFLVLSLLYFSLVSMGAYASCAVPPGATLRPGAGDDPTHVSVGLYVLDLSKIDEFDQSFQVDFMVDVFWHDERLGAVTHAHGSPCQFKLEEVWNPGLAFFNRRRGQLYMRQIVSVQADGTVTYMQRFYGNVASPLDLRDFPYDEQTLPITLASFYAPDEVSLELDQRRTGSNEDFSLAGWDVIDSSMRSYDRELSVEQGDQQAIIPVISYSFQVRRKINYYLWKVVLPITVISCMSWAVFWISRRELGPTLAVSSTAILTLIAFLFSLRHVQPPVSYLTHMDYLIYASLSLLFCTHFAGLWSRGLTMTGREAGAKHIDSTARWLVPLTYCCLLVWYLFGT